MTNETDQQPEPDAYPAHWDTPANRRRAQEAQQTRHPLNPSTND